MPLTIERGLFSHMVLQRNKSGKSDAAFAGVADINGPLEVRVAKTSRAVPGYSWKHIGEVTGGRLKGRLAGLPAGGPYTIDLRVRGKAGEETARIDDVLVGDVWILAGQSNMQGTGRRVHAEKPHSLVRAFYADDRWAVACDPIHNIWNAVDPIHRKITSNLAENPVNGAGPAIAFAKEMFRRTGVPQGLIACAHGGTTLAQWNLLYKDPAGSLYKATLRRFHKNGGKVSGVLWYQGESDTNSPKLDYYAAEMRRLVASSRRDLGDARLPWVIVQLGRHLPMGQTRFWNEVQEMQRLLPDVIPRSVMVPTIDLELDDAIHIGGNGLRRLGIRLAQAMTSLTLPSKNKSGAADSTLPPITIKRVTLEQDLPATTHIIVEFANVVGKLHAASRPVGFTVADAAISFAPITTRLDGNRAILRIPGAVHEQTERLLHYGYGCDPVCNITDEADRSLPVFGPLPLGTPKAFPLYIRSFQISAPQPSAGKLEKLRYPTDLDALELASQTFGSTFCDIHTQVAEDAPKFAGDPLYYFRCAFTCEEEMKLAATLNYDGPLKVWLDRREILHDPKGNNPATAHTAVLPFTSTHGRHEVLVALGTNGGKAWGISLRLHRTDIPARRVLKRDYALPRLLA